MNPAENWQTAAGPIAAEPEAAPAFAPQPIPAAALPPPLMRKNPGLAALLSLFPGMGHIYNGLYMRGVTFFLVIASLIGIVVDKHPIFGLAIAFFWIFNVIDAYRQATLINYGYAQDLGLTDLPKVPRAGQGGLVAGVLLSLIGLTAVLDRYFEIRLDWIFDLWPFALVVIGVWLIVASFRDRRRA
jgi:TM2 domain-containing membrane protein YozV